MNTFRLTLITRNQKSLDRAKKFAILICGTLNCENGYEISKYEKFDNAYRIEIMGPLKNVENAILESIELTDRICSPWMVTYQRTENIIELVFNKLEWSSFRRKEFNVLNWAQFKIENE